jgi:Nif-specific regulatory protein
MSRPCITTGAGAAAITATQKGLYSSYPSSPEDVPLPIGVREPVNMSVIAPLRPEAASLPRTIADLERERLLEALQRCGGVQTRATALLGLTPRQLGYKMRKYHIDPRRGLS